MARRKEKIGSILIGKQARRQLLLVVAYAVIRECQYT